MSPAILAGLGVLLLIAAIAVTQRARPKVTHIETKPEDEDRDA